MTYVQITVSKFSLKLCDLYLGTEPDFVQLRLSGKLRR